MLYNTRSHNIVKGSVFVDIDSFMEHFVKCSTWTVCAAFIIDPKFDPSTKDLKLVKPTILIANDSTGPDGAQEYAIFQWKNEKWIQFDSFTTSWSRPIYFRDYLEIQLKSIQEKGKPTGEWYDEFNHTRLTFDPDHICWHCR